MEHEHPRAVPRHEHRHRVSAVWHRLIVFFRTSRHFHARHASLLEISHLFGVRVYGRLLPARRASNRDAKNHCNNTLVTEIHTRSFPDTESSRAYAEARLRSNPRLRNWARVETRVHAK